MTDVEVQEAAPFQQAVEQIWGVIAEAASEEWDLINQLNDFSEAIYIKNAESVLVYGNREFHDRFVVGKSAVGRPTDRFLDETIVEVSRHSDGLIIAGASRLEFEHAGHGRDGNYYSMLTHKRSLAPIGKPGLAILGVSRLQVLPSESSPRQRLGLVQSHRVYLGLSDEDRQIAQMLAMGAKGREIAESVGMTIRTVESHKKRVLDTLELDTTIDLVKLLVRLEDRGFLDLGL